MRTIHASQLNWYQNFSSSLDTTSAEIKWSTARRKIIVAICDF